MWNKYAYFVFNKIVTGVLLAKCAKLANFMWENSIAKHCKWVSVALTPKICFDILIFKNFDIHIDNIKLIKLTLILILIFE